MFKATWWFVWRFCRLKGFNFTSNITKILKEMCLAKLFSKHYYSRQGDQIETGWKLSLTVGCCCQIETNDQYI